MEVREPSAKYLVRPGYKQTEVGVIPEDWNVARLDGLSGFVTKGATPTTYGFKWVADGILFLRSECVSERGLDLAQSMYISEDAHRCLRRSEVEQGDLLMTITGNVGRVVRLDGIEKGNINQHIARIRVVSGEADARYVYFALSRPEVRKRFDAITTGQAYPQIGLKQVREAEIALPPVREQQAIADALGDADALIESLEHLLAKQRLLRQATMQALLTGERRLPGFEGAWRDMALGETGAFLKGSGVARDDAQSGDLPCIRYGEIYTTHDDVIRDFQSWISPQVAAGAARLKQGDILFAGSGETKEEIGKCVAFVDDCEAYAGGDIVILRAHGCDPVFLGYALNTPAVNRQKASFGQGDAVVHISASALAQVVVRVPPLAEQTAIATALSDLDAEIAALEARIAKARLLKQGMMQELLTGRIRLV